MAHQEDGSQFGLPPQEALPRPIDQVLSPETVTLRDTIVSRIETQLRKVGLTDGDQIMLGTELDVVDRKFSIDHNRPFVSQTDIIATQVEATYAYLPTLPNGEMLKPEVIVVAAPKDQSLFLNEHTRTYVTSGDGIVSVDVVQYTTAYHDVIDFEAISANGEVAFIPDSDYTDFADDVEKIPMGPLKNGNEGVLLVVLDDEARTGVYVAPLELPIGWKKAFGENGRLHSEDGEEGQLVSEEEEKIERPRGRDISADIWEAEVGGWQDMQERREQHPEEGLDPNILGQGGYDFISGGLRRMAGEEVPDHPTGGYGWTAEMHEEADALGELYRRGTDGSEVSLKELRGRVERGEITLEEGVTLVSEGVITAPELYDAMRVKREAMEKIVAAQTTAAPTAFDLYMRGEMSRDDYMKVAPQAKVDPSRPVYSSAGRSSLGEMTRRERRQRGRFSHTGASEAAFEKARAVTPDMGYNRPEGNGGKSGRPKSKFERKARLANKKKGKK